MANETIVLDSEEVYQNRGATHRSTAQFMDKKSLHIMVRQLKNQGKEVEEIAISYRIGVIKRRSKQTI